MCYASPGPRCSAHARTALARTVQAVAVAEKAKNPAALAAAKKEHSLATKDYLLTPEGIRGLRAKGLDDAADAAYDLRRRQLAAYNAAQAKKAGTLVPVTVTSKEEVAKGLARLGDLDTRRELAWSSDDEVTLTMLAHDDDETVLGAVVANDATPAPALAILARKGYEFEALRHDNTTPAIADEVALTDPTLAATHGQMSPKAVLALLHRKGGLPAETVGAIARNRHASTAVLTELGESTLSYTDPDLDEGEPRLVAVDVAANPNTHPSTLAVLTMSPSEEVRAAVASNEHTLPAAQKVLMGDSSERVRSALARKSAVPFVLRQLASDKEQFVRYYAGMNRETSLRDVWDGARSAKDLDTMGFRLRGASDTEVRAWKEYVSPDLADLPDPMFISTMVQLKEVEMSRVKL